MGLLEDTISAFYIAKKDIKEYYLKPPTVSWGMVFPVAFTLAFLFKSKGAFLDILPGLIILALFFGTTSMTSASIVFERKIGSFERFLLFPISYFGIVLGKVLSGFFFGIISLLAILVIVLPIILHVYLHSIILVVVLVLSAFMFSAFGVFISFTVKDPTNTMVILNSIRFPMIFLCGIFIPISNLPKVLQIIAFLIPLTYSVEATRYALAGCYEIIPPILSIAVIIMLTIVFLILSAIEVKLMRK